MVTFCRIFCRGLCCLCCFCYLDLLVFQVCFLVGQPSQAKKSSPSRCLTGCRRVGLTGFSAGANTCFVLLIGTGKHDCQFVYQVAAVELP